MRHILNKKKPDQTAILIDSPVKRMFHKKQQQQRNSWTLKSTIFHTIKQVYCRSGTEFFWFCLIFLFESDIWNNFFSDKYCTSHYVNVSLYSGVQTLKAGYYQNRDIPVTKELMLIISPYIADVMLH